MASDHPVTLPDQGVQKLTAASPEGLVPRAQRGPLVRFWARLGDAFLGEEVAVKDVGAGVDRH